MDSLQDEFQRTVLAESESSRPVVAEAETQKKKAASGSMGAFVFSLETNMGSCSTDTNATVVLAEKRPSIASVLDEIHVKGCKGRSSSTEEFCLSVLEDCEAKVEGIQNQLPPSRIIVEMSTFKWACLEEAWRSPTGSNVTSVVMAVARYWPFVLPFSIQRLVIWLGRKIEKRIGRDRPSDLQITRHDLDKFVNFLKNDTPYWGPALFSEWIYPVF